MALRFAPIALAAGALALAASTTSAAAQVKIKGKEVMLSNQSVYRSPATDLPSPPKLGMAPAAGPKTGGPSQYSNSFTCIPGSAAAPAEKITIHGQYDLRSARAPSSVPRPGLRAR